MIVKLLTEHHLELLSLKEGCRGLSESTLVKMSNCLKSHVAAQIFRNALGSAVYQYLIGQPVVLQKVDRPSEPVYIDRWGTFRRADQEKIVKMPTVTADNVTCIIFRTPLVK